MCVDCRETMSACDFGGTRCSLCCGGGEGEKLKKWWKLSSVCVGGGVGGSWWWGIVYLLPGSLKENLHVHVLCTSNSVHERHLQHKKSGWDYVPSVLIKHKGGVLVSGIVLCTILCTRDRAWCPSWFKEMSSFQWCPYRGVPLYMYCAITIF